MDLNKMFNALNNSGVTGGLAGGLAGGAISGALMSKKGRKMAGAALKIGGIAAVGGLAYKAYQNYQHGQQQQAQAGNVSNLAHANPQSQAGLENNQWEQLSSAQFEIEDNTDADSRGLILIRAMIAAANADGHVDAEERQRIFEQVEQQELTSEEKATLFDALSKPDSLETICSSANEPALATEVYAVSAMAVDTEEPMSKHYLEALSARLRLPSLMVESIHAELAAV